MFTISCYITEQHQLCCSGSTCHCDKPHWYQGPSKHCAFTSSFSIDTLEYPLWSRILLLLCEDTTANGLHLSEYGLWWPLVPPQHVPNSQNTANPSFRVYCHLHDQLITQMHQLEPLPSSFSSFGFLMTLFLFPHLYIKPYIGSARWEDNLLLLV